MPNHFLKKAVLFVLFNLASVIGYSQQTHLLKGTVSDAQTNNWLSFATVKIMNAKDTSFVSGTTTTENGEYEFKIPYGEYIIEVNYVGYKKYVSDKQRFNTNDSSFLALKIINTNTQLNEVTVQAEKSSMELSLDKRVFNVGKDLANAGGTAQDILINIPSVTVDPEGAIKLRGNSNVRILIDGKPSGMVSFKGGAGLKQLQASMIDRVEIVTNPSAKYEAEGSAGIINIILKKDQKKGFNGSFELISGFPANYGAAANLNYRHKKINFFINYGLAYRKNPYFGDIFQKVTGNDTTKILNQKNNGDVSGLDNNIRGGLAYFFTEKSVLTASYMYSKAGGIRYTNNEYYDFLNTINNPVGSSVRIQKEVEKEPLSEYVINYTKSFKTKGHELTGQFRYLDHFENSDQDFTEIAFNPNGEKNSKKSFVQTSVNDEFEKQYLFQIDYSRPFSKTGKVEFGARASLRNMVNDFVVNNVTENGEVPIPELDNYFIYNENISAAYGIISNKQKKITYQLGLRTEWTDINTTLEKTNETNPRKYWNVFPSAHFTYIINTDNSLQLSYSRRIKRPTYNDLSPFMTVSDSRNFFSGNPNLNPDYSDIIEFGHLKNFESGSLTYSVYYRYTNDFIFNIRNVNNEGFARSLPENLKSETAYGAEFTGNTKFNKWWKADLNFNIFNAKYDGSNIDQLFVAQTVTWFLRHTSRFTLPKQVDMQIRANYEAKQKTANGVRKGIGFVDVAFKKDIFNKKGSVNFSIIDVFNSRWSRNIMQGANFYTESNRLGRPRQINLTISYRIKN